MNGAELIAAERKRQIEVEGYTSDRNSEPLVLAGVAYATPAPWRNSHGGNPPYLWPWSEQGWKPTPDDRVRELVKAGALIAAAIDVLLAKERTK